MLTTYGSDADILRAIEAGATGYLLIEVLGLVAQGASNELIARDLAIRGATVKTHLRHIFAKLSVDDRTAGVTTAIARGIIRV